MCMVSVIVPIYGVEDYLPRCIDSILSQSHEDFELILVDDESPDRCGHICDCYALRDDRIRVIHKKNGGVCSARNAGIEAASGQYITFCDPDDYWKTDHLQNLVSTAVANGADVVEANYSSVDIHGNITWESSYQESCEELTDQESRFRFLVQQLLGERHVWSVCMRLFNSDIIHKHHIRFCETCQNYAEDIGFVFQYCLVCKKVCQIPNHTYLYFTRPGSMIQSSLKVVKLDQMNELSLYLYQHYHNVFRESRFKNDYPLVHFILLCREYRKIAHTDRYHTFSEEMSRIQKKNWYYQNMRRVPFRYWTIKRYFGKDFARRILLLASYATHGSWKRFTIESAITYKWMVKKL